MGTTVRSSKWTRIAGSVVEQYERNGLQLIVRRGRLPHRGRQRQVVTIYEGRTKRMKARFFAADDFDSTGEMVSVVRGKGLTGRMMYRSHDDLPRRYRHMRTEIARDRIAGDFECVCVVVHATDLDAMLEHAALQVGIGEQPD